MYCQSPLLLLKVGCTVQKVATRLAASKHTYACMYTVSGRCVGFVTIEWSRVSRSLQIFVAIFYQIRDVRTYVHVLPITNKSTCRLYSIKSGYSVQRLAAKVKDTVLMMATLASVWGTPGGVIIYTCTYLKCSVTVSI